jgi:cholesterol oxidase
VYQRISSAADRIQSSYTVVVIGSGYGGGIAASRLARAGQTVCVLERGKEIAPGDYPSTMVETAGEVQIDSPHTHEGKPTALFDFRLNRDISVLVGCGLGGTSLINANVALQATTAVLADERWPAELRATDALADGYRHARDVLQPTPFPEDRPKPAKLAALERSAEAIGAPCRRAPVYVTFDAPEGGVNRFGVQQEACQMCGNCVTGCNFAAKNTVLMNYLPDAKAHGAEIFSEVSVRRVSRDDAGRWVVHYYVTGSWEQKLRAEERTVTADVVILAAGALGSTEILLRSRRVGLPMSDRVGRRFSGNGDLLGFNYDGAATVDAIGAEPPRAPAPGPCITGYVDARAEGSLQGYVIEEAVIPGALAPVLPALLAGFFPTGANTAASPEAVAAQVGRLAESLALGAYHGATQSTQTMLAIGYDDGEGAMQLEHDRLRISWPGVGAQPTFAAESDGFLTATKAHGGVYIKEPIWSRLLGDHLVTIHPLGGCPMAPRAELGVVDHKGRVFADRQGTAVHDGLYVSDGSVIPLPLGVNPSLTICAITERCCALIAADRGWDIDYGP